MRVWLTLPILWLAAGAAFAKDPLAVMAASRDGRIEFFDERLEPLGAIGVNRMLESVTASPDGRRLYVAQENPTPGTCCGLFSLDLETHSMCLLTAPAMFGMPSPDGRFILTQGTPGVELFDAKTLSPMGAMSAPAAYNLQPSPDGRWLLGITNSPKPSLDVFDMKARALVRHIAVPAEPVTGAWAGDRFYLFHYSAGEATARAWLWSVRPDDWELSTAKLIGLPDLHGRCQQPVLLMLSGAPDRLFLAEALGFRVDRRRACPDAPAGGIWAIRPSSGQVMRIAQVDVNRMAVTPDGKELYVIQSGRPARNREDRILRIDVETGAILNSFGLARGGWNLSLAHIPATLIPRGELRAYTYCSR